jgi:hypothetical protein
MTGGRLLRRGDHQALCIIWTKALIAIGTAYKNKHVLYLVTTLILRPHLWSSGQNSWLQIQSTGFDSPALPDFLSDSGSVTGPTQPREDK